MKSLVDQGIVLSRTNFQEADRILTVITANHGKIRLMAKGVRKVKSKLAGGIELFSINDLTFIEGRGEIDTLISSRLKQNFGHIISDINRTMFGYELLKRLNRATEDNADIEYFELLAKALNGLNDLLLEQERIELWFNCQLLKLAGHSPNLKNDTNNQPLKSNQTYQFDIEDMTFTTNPDGRYNANQIKLLRLAILSEKPERLGQIKKIGYNLTDCLQLSKLMVGQFIRS
ncbi:MAG TPA: DNA repair protein RecO [Candidatus Saccharimonadales bacterium]|nr:DNA repair protein RecO [Candidatus Saccharimonadales bacterium]